MVATQLTPFQQPIILFSVQDDIVSVLHGGPPILTPWKGVWFMKRLLATGVLFAVFAAATSCAPQCAPCPPPYELQTQVAVLQTQVAAASAAPSEAPPTPTPVRETPTRIPPTSTPTSPAPAQTAVPCPVCPQSQEEAIVITSPVAGETVTNPVVVTGISDPTFEQSLGIQVIGQDGRVLGQGAAMISAELGERGSFTGEVTFSSPPAEERGRITVFDMSARDGGLLHLASIEVMLAGS
jgi:hypothetical protein